MTFIYALCTSLCSDSYVAVNITLLAFAADRRAAVDMDRKAAAPAAAVDRYRLRLSAGPTAANPPHAAVAGELDRRTPYRYIDPAVICLYTSYGWVSSELANSTIRSSESTQRLSNDLV